MQTAENTTRTTQAARCSKLRRFLRRENGSVAVETALSTVLMMTCVLAVIECCMMVYTYSTYEDAAQQGVRYATMHGIDSTDCSGPSEGCGDSTGANVVSAVKTFAANYVAYISGMDIDVIYPDNTSTPNSRVEVSITYTYKPLFHFPGFARSFTVISEGRILY